MIQQHIIETDTVEKAVKNNNSFFFLIKQKLIIKPAKKKYKKGCKNILKIFQQGLSLQQKKICQM